MVELLWVGDEFKNRVRHVYLYFYDKMNSEIIIVAWPVSVSYSKVRAFLLMINVYYTVV